ncbi:hypothetical protein Q3G72_033051 [Acer saccharum]|nr:hypothetical protein Q3G72_033051 [Acer saccharum]
MRSLEELKSIDDGGCFDLLVNEAEKAANGNELLKSGLLTESVLQGFIDMHIRKGLADEAFRKETTINNGLLNFKIPKKPRSRVPVPAIVQDSVSKLESKNSSSMKRGFVEVKEEDEEIEKKQREADHSLEKVKKKKKTTNKKTNLNDQRLPDPVIPQDFQDEIDKLNGTDVMLVGEKEMTVTDMDKHQCRFSIPKGKVRTDAFLRKEDNPIVGVECSLIQPCLQKIEDMKFKRWNMSTSTFSYTLINKWNSVAHNKENGLQKGCLVQLWSFRVGSNLWFALVNLDLKQKQGEDNGASSGTRITNI